jgi:Tol biopolymer transport system component
MSRATARTLHVPFVLSSSLRHHSCTRTKLQRGFRPAIESLEARVLLSLDPLTLTDSLFWGDSAFAENPGSGFALSSGVSMSADGQIVVFESEADNLVPNDLNDSFDVFAYNRGTGRVSLVSASAAGTGSGNGESVDARVTPDGRFVVFRSGATNLDGSINVVVNAGGDLEVFVRDLTTGVTRLVSVNAAGTGAGDGGFTSTPSISDDGRFVVWSSNSTNLVPNDTNGQRDVFLRDLQSGTTTLVSHTPTGGFGNRHSNTPFLSGNGQFVVFKSDADNLVDSDNNTAPDLFLFNRLEIQVAQQIELLTPNRTNTGSAGTSATNLSPKPISADGRFVVFESDSGQLVSARDDRRNEAFGHDQPAAGRRRRDDIQR